MPRLTLKSGPLLIACFAAKNSTDERDAWIDENVTAQAHEWLGEPVSVDERVTLADLLGLLACSPLLQEVYRRSYAQEISAEACRGSAPVTREDPDDGIEDLELCQHWSLDTTTRTYEPLHRLTLHGIGVVLQHDRPELGCSAGQRVQWAVKASPLRSLLALPLRVSPVVVVSEAGDKGNGRDIDEALHPHVTLGQVLHSVLWELSFFGTPDDTSTCELAARLEAAEQAPLRTFTLEEFDEWLDKL